MINDKNEVLVVKEKNGPVTNIWKIPGGRVDPGNLIRCHYLPFSHLRSLSLPLWLFIINPKEKRSLMQLSEKFLKKLASSVNIRVSYAFVKHQKFLLECNSSFFRLLIS